jgi:hypothetical protein
LHACVFVGLAEEEVCEAVLLLVDAVPPTNRVTEVLVEEDPVPVDEPFDAPVDGKRVELVGRVIVVVKEAYVTPVGTTLSPVSDPVVSVVTVPVTRVSVSLELAGVAVPLMRVVEAASTAWIDSTAGHSWRTNIAHRKVSQMVWMRKLELNDEALVEYGRDGNTKVQWRRWGSDVERNKRQQKFYGS